MKSQFYNLIVLKKIKSSQNYKNVITIIKKSDLIKV